MKTFLNIVLSLVVFVTGCFIPELGEEDVYRLKDNVPPQIILYSPADQEPYGNSVMLRGLVIDFAEKTQTIKGRVNSITAEITGEAAVYNIKLKADNTFSQIINTNDYSGTIELKIKAQDWNRMETVVTCTLKSGPFASFSAQPGNKSVTLSWNPVALADMYTIYYTDDGSVPSETNGKKHSTTATTLKIDSLKNGVLYSFIIHTVSNDPLIMSTRSHVVKAVPLSPFTLYPSIIAYHDMLDVRWNKLPGIDKYNVYRRTDLGGDWEQIGGEIAANYYADKDAQPGTCYYYRIAPALINSIRSEPAPGSLAPLKPFFYNVGSTGGLAGGNHLVTNNNICYVTGTCGGITGIHCFDTANPGNPVRLSSLSFTDPVRELAVAADRLIVLTEAELYCIDISQPAFLPAPVMLSRPTTLFKDITCAGSTLYVLEEGTGILSFDLSLSSPAAVPLVTTNASIDKIVITDGKLYYIAYTIDPDTFVTTSSALKVMDLNSPVTNSYNLCNASNTIWYKAAIEAVNGNTPIISFSDDLGGGVQLHIVDIANFAIYFGGGTLTPAVVLPDINAIQIYRNYLYIANPYKMIIYNCAENRQIEYKQLPAGIKSIAFYQDYLLACQTGMNNLNTYYIRTPFDVKQPLKDYDLKTEGYAMKTEGALLYLVFDTEIEIRVISDPANNASLRQLLLEERIDPAYPVYIKILGKYLFFANKADFYIYDTSQDNSSPVSHSKINRGEIRSLELYGDYAYLACGEGGAAILDIANPYDPFLYSSFTEYTPVIKSFLIEGSLYYICPTQILIQDAAYLPLTRLVSNPPIFLTDNLIINSIEYYPQLFLFYQILPQQGFQIVSSTLVLPNFPRMQEKSNMFVNFTPPDLFLISGTYAFAYNKNANYIFDFTNLDNFNYNGKLPYPFTACGMNKDKLVLYNSVNGKLTFLNYGND